jgi:hypothetical protein
VNDLNKMDLVSAKEHLFQAHTQALDIFKNRYPTSMSDVKDPSQAEAFDKALESFEIFVELLIENIGGKDQLDNSAKDDFVVINQGGGHWNRLIPPQT